MAHETRSLRLLATSAAALLAMTGCATQGPSEPSAGSAAGQASGCDTEGVSQGVTDSTIKLGAFTPLTGPVADPGNGALLGQQLAFDRVNAEGGVQGRTIELVTVDDKYDPAEAQKAVRRLNEQDEVFALSGGVGTPNFVATLPYIKQEAIPAIGPYAPSNQVGVMENPNVYMIWPNYVDEFEVITKYLIEQVKPESVAMVQMSGDVGDDALTGVELASEGTDFELDKIVTVEATTTDYSAAVQELKSTGAEWVISINQPTGTGQVIQAAKKIGYEPRWATWSGMTDSSWIAAFPAEADGMIAATVVAPFDSEDANVKEFVEAVRAETGEEPTVWNAIGYAQALVTIEALEKAPALTRECLESSLQGLDGFETGLIPPVTFAADSRQGTSAAGLAEIADGQVVELLPFQPVS